MRCRFFSPLLNTFPSDQCLTDGSCQTNFVSFGLWNFGCFQQYLSFFFSFLLYSYLFFHFFGLSFLLVIVREYTSFKAIIHYGKRVQLSPKHLPAIRVTVREWKSSKAIIVHDKRIQLSPSKALVSYKLMFNSEIWKVICCHSRTLYRCKILLIKPLKWAKDSYFINQQSNITAEKV